MNEYLNLYIIYIILLRVCFSQAYCYIISGTCFAIGLKFAGSFNKSAYDTLVGYYHCISLPNEMNGDFW